MKAALKNYRQAPRKVRLVADQIRGKRVSDVLIELQFMAQKAAPALRKLVASAVANARQTDDAVREENLVITHIAVDKGTTFFRTMPRARGSASPIRRESSHVQLSLSEKPAEKAPEKTPEKSEGKNDKAKGKDTRIETQKAETSA